MTQYLISFNDGAMDHIQDDEWADVGKSAHAAMEEAVDAGVWVFGAGLQRQRANIVDTDGTVTDGPYPETKEVIGGFTVVEVATREEAVVWAGKIAAGCRCAQEVRELMPDPEGDEYIRKAALRK
ncbi:YciI family protein [Micromonosporaceae bacterium Da 78-11]